MLEFLARRFHKAGPPSTLSFLLGQDILVSAHFLSFPSHIFIFKMKRILVEGGDEARERKKPRSLNPANSVNKNHATLTPKKETPGVPKIENKEVFIDINVNKRIQI